MDISFSKEQLILLLKIVYLGEWYVNAHRTTDIIKKYEEIDQYILSQAYKAGLTEYVEYDEQLKKYFPTKCFEEDEEIEDIKDDHDNETFWDELIDRLTQRDISRKYASKKNKKLTPEEHDNMITERFRMEENYSAEFEKNEIENLEVTNIFFNKP